MTKGDGRNGREQSQTKRGVRTEATENLPLVSAKRGKFASLKDAKIEALIFARLTDYKSFIKDVEGEEPDDGAIISASLEMLLDADVGFERWLVEQRRKNRQTGETNAGTLTGRGAATTSSGADNSA